MVRTPYDAKPVIPSSPPVSLIIDARGRPVTGIEVYSQPSHTELVRYLAGK